MAPGRAVTPHAHDYAETFTCVQGRLTVTVAGFPYELRPGQEATAPAGVVHAWSNDDAERAVALVELRPGHAGFETTLRVLYGLAADGLTRADGIPRNPLHLALVLTWGEACLPGTRALLGPIGKLLAAVARMRGIDRELLERYA